MRNESLTEQLEAHMINRAIARDLRKERDADKERADKALKRMHQDCCDDMRENYAYARGAVQAFYEIGVLNQNERRLWELALRSCPGHDGGGRVWCAYCGDLPSTSRSERTERTE